MTAPGGRAMRGEAMLAKLAAATVLVVTAAILFSFQLLAPSSEVGGARIFDVGAAASLDLLAVATRL
jgi:hypothetical protein